MSEKRPSPLPQRSSLSDQTAQCLRGRIESGQWQDELPSEITLCRELQISRVTLRRAFQQLTHEGLIHSRGRGQHHQVSVRSSKVPLESKGKIVRVLAPFSFWKMGAISHKILEGISMRIASSGRRVEFESHPSVFRTHNPKELERLQSLPDTAGWVLFFSTEPMQRWFASRGLPCVVAGRRHRDIDLSAVYPDSVAVARHAVGQFTARRHKNLVYLISSLTSLGDRFAAAAFKEEANRLGAHAEIIEYAGDPAAIKRAMANILAARPRPTACFITCPEDSVTALCHTLRAGLAVPDQMEFLIGWDDPILDCTVPTLAHYNFDGEKMGKNIGNLILSQIRHVTHSVREIAMIPEFTPGGTLSNRNLG